MKDKIEKLKLKFPELSSIMIFIKAIKGKKIKESELRNSFDDFVVRSDYIGTPKEQIIGWIKKEIIK